MNSVQRVVVVPHKPMATIYSNLHGQFAERPCELIYPGIFGTTSCCPVDLEEEDSTYVYSA